MKDFLVRIFVFFAFYLGIGAPLGMLLVGPAPTESNELIEYSPERYPTEEEKRISKLWWDYQEKYRTVTGGTIPLTIGPTAVLLTYLVLKKKK